MNNEEKILDMLTKLTNAIDILRTELKSEIQDVRTELKSEIQDVRTELKSEIQDVRTELKSEIQENRKAIVKIETKIENEISDKIRGIYDSREVTNTKLEKISSDIEDIKETLSNVELITASNWRDLTKLKSIK